MDFSTESFLMPFLIVACTAAVMTALACFVFGKRMRADLA
jgi:hypothetical protein